MGLTMSELNQREYLFYISRGLSHEEAIEQFPKHKREQVEKDIDKDPFESHFGVSIGRFLLIIIVVVIITVVLAVLLK